MSKTLSVTDVKNENVKQVLRCVRDKQPISRADIARVTGLSRPTVSALVAGLIEEGFVLEQGDGASSSGRKPIMLVPNLSHKYAIGLDYSNSRLIRGCICDMSYQIIATSERPCLAKQDDILKLTAELIDELLTFIPDASTLAGIGIGVTGIVDADNNRAINSERYDLRIDYSGYLQARYGAPVFMENDSNVAALAEYTQGCTKGKANFIYVLCSEFIGMGIFLNGSLFYGNMFNSGEVVHMTHEGISETCSCGNKGCIGIRLSESNIISQINKADKKVTGMKQVYRLFSNGDPKTEEVVGEATQYLSWLIANTSKLLGVDDFVIGGFFTGFGERLLSALSEQVKKEHVGFRSGAINIRYSMFLEDGVALGAASLILDKVWDLTL